MGSSGDDLLIADHTAFDANDAALRAILAEWTSERDYAMRIANLSGLGSGSAGNAALVETPGTRLLIDGGIANNLPIDATRKLCADVVIAVNISTPPLKRTEITSVLSVTGQLINFLGLANVDRQLKSLGERDVLIVPELGDITSGSFDRARDAIRIGEEAARKMVDGLRRYSLPPEQYRALVRLTAALCRVFPKIKCDYPRDSTGKLVTAKLPDGELEAYAGLLGHYHIQTNKIDPGPAFQWDHVVKGAAALAAGDDAVFLPAEDGGYVLVGLKEPRPALFAGLPWGTPAVMEETRARLEAAGLSWSEPAMLWDLDEAGDYRRYRQLAT